MVTTRRGVGAYRWELAMVAVTAVWGSTFGAGARRGRQVPPFTFLAYRFLAAALLLAAIRPRLTLGGPGRRPRPRAGRRGAAGAARPAGVVIGLALFAGYGFQTVGLQ